MPLTDQEFMRYSRHLMVGEIGEAGQEKIKQATVLIVGMGGLGCPAAQYLVAAGVGHVLLLDHDEIELSNLQRQILYTTDDIGKTKVSVATRRLQALNPHCKLTPLHASIVEQDIGLLFEHGVDIVLDCTDRPETRHFINQMCLEARVQLVVAAAIQGAGQLVSFDFTSEDSPCYQCLFPDDQQTPVNCATAGVLSPLLGVMGSLQATEAIRLMLGRRDQLNQLHVFDTWGMSMRGFRVTKNQTCQVCGDRSVPCG